MNDTGSRAEQARAKREAQIITVAKKIIAERGYHSASVGEIIKQAGIARGTFYLYFEGKRQLFDYILLDALNQLRALIKTIEVDDPIAPSPGQQLRDNLKRVLSFVVGDHDLAKILLIQGRAADTEASEKVDNFFSEVRALVAMALRRGQPLGLVRPCDAPLLAAILVGAARGLIEYSMAHGNVDIDAMVEEMVTVARAAVFEGKHQ